MFSADGAATGAAVALLAEGVDRNTKEAYLIHYDNKSPSSRRAWIEICGEPGVRLSGHVALLAEGVDRNRETDTVFRGRSSRPPRGGRG